MRSIVVAAVAFLALALPPSLASHCVDWRTSDPEASAAGLYFDNDVCQPACLLSTWVYQESNGLPGLQRADARVDDTCHGQVEADRRII